jgi:hypothetical protein
VASADRLPLAGVRGGCLAATGGLLVELGYFLSSEEHGPRELLHQAQLAFDAGIGSV